MMKTKLRKKSICFLAAFWAAVIMSATAAFAAGASVKITLHKYKGYTKQQMALVKFTAYKVGEIGADNNPYIYPQFGIPRYPQTGQENRAASRKLQKTVVGKAKKIASGVTDKKGVVTLRGLDDGVYYIRPSKVSNYGTVEGSVIHFPYYLGRADGTVEYPIYSVEYEPKSSPLEGKLKSSSRKSSGGPGTISSPKTGDYNRYIPYLIMIFTGLFLIYIAKNKKKTPAEEV